MIYAVPTCKFAYKLLLRVLQSRVKIVYRWRYHHKSAYRKQSHEWKKQKKIIWTQKESRQCMTGCHISTWKYPSCWPSRWCHTFITHCRPHYVAKTELA